MEEGGESRQNEFLLALKAAGAERMCSFRENHLLVRVPIARWLEGLLFGQRRGWEGDWFGV